MMSLLLSLLVCVGILDIRQLSHSSYTYIQYVKGQSWYVYVYYNRSSVTCVEF